jgi:hypothetical protein
MRWLGKQLRALTQLYLAGKDNILTRVDRKKVNLERLLNMPTEQNRFFFATSEHCESMVESPRRKYTEM